MADSFYETTKVLAASAVRTPTAGTNGTAWETDGKRVAYNVVLDVTDKTTNANDTCDVYIDVLIDTLWINAIHFTQLLGNGTNAERQAAVLAPHGSNTAPTVVTADAASGAVRGDMFGSSVRARWVIVDGAGAGDPTFTFSVTAYAI